MKNTSLFYRGCLRSISYVVFSLLLSACAIGGGVSSGSLHRNLEVEKIFSSATILPDHAYYIQNNNFSDPEAIIAIKNTYHLKSKLWSQVNWTQKDFQDAVFWLEHDEIDLCPPDGGYLVTPDGIQIGIWYSQRNQAIVKNTESDVVEVYPFDYGLNSPCNRNYSSDE